MVAVPADSPRTTPVALTDATAGCKDTHATGLSVSAFPAASNTAAVSCTVVPTAIGAAGAEIDSRSTAWRPSTAYVPRLDIGAVTVFASVSTVLPATSCHAPPVAR
jgi:hypothetical protein